MEAPFLEGVPYFSRDEEATARRITSTRRGKADAAGINIRKDDVVSLELVERVRLEIMIWKSLPEVSRIPSMSVGSKLDYSA